MSADRGRTVSLSRELESRIVLRVVEQVLDGSVRTSAEALVEVRARSCSGSRTLASVLVWSKNSLQLSLISTGSPKREQAPPRGQCRLLRCTTPRSRQQASFRSCSWPDFLRLLRQISSIYIGRRCAIPRSSSTWPGHAGSASGRKGTTS